VDSRKISILIDLPNVLMEAVSDRDCNDLRVEILREVRAWNLLFAPGLGGADVCSEGSPTEKTC
jgi:hypothetical protein